MKKYVGIITNSAEDRSEVYGLCDKQVIENLMYKFYLEEYEIAKANEMLEDCEKYTKAEFLNAAYSDSDRYMESAYIQTVAYHINYQIEEFEV